MAGPDASLYATAVYGTDTYGDPEVTFIEYGTAVYGRDMYGGQLVTLPTTGVKTTLNVGTVSVSVVDIGTDVSPSVNGNKTTVNLGTVSITAVQFDFESVKNNYERTRTVYVHRVTNSSDRTVKVA